MAAIFVAATRQHVGKTSSCLGIVNGMRARLKDCGFIKPVGQRHVPVFEDGGTDQAASAAAAMAAAATAPGLWAMVAAVAMARERAAERAVATAEGATAAAARRSLR